MKIFDKLAQVKLKRELKKWGLDEAKLDIDISGISAEDLMRMEQKFKGFIKKHPALKNLHLDSLPAILKHKDEIRKVIEENKGEVQELLEKIKKEKK